MRRNLPSIATRSVLGAGFSTGRAAGSAWRAMLTELDVPARRQNSFYRPNRAIASGGAQCPGGDRPRSLIQLPGRRSPRGGKGWRARAQKCALVSWRVHPKLPGIDGHADHRVDAVGVEGVNLLL